jgi:hypothetical protein
MYTVHTTYKKSKGYSSIPVSLPICIRKKVSRLTDKKVPVSFRLSRAVIDIVRKADSQS